MTVARESDNTRLTTANVLGSVSLAIVVPTLDRRKVPSRRAWPKKDAYFVNVHSNHKLAYERLPVPCTV